MKTIMMLLAFFITLFASASGTKYLRRHLIAGDSHSGTNLHAILQFSPLASATVDVSITSVGGQASNIQVGIISFDSNASPMASFTKNASVHEFVDDSNNAIMDLTLGTCTISEVTGVGLNFDLECPLLFNDGADLAALKDHIACDNNECAHLGAYVVTARYAGSTSATSMTFTAPCNTTGDYHDFQNICILDSCQRCALDHYCEDVSGVLNSCVSCGDGEDTRNAANVFVMSGASQCVPCEIGKYQMGTDECATCNDGSETRVSGTYATSGATECIECDIGKYQTGTGECVVCTEGYHTTHLAIYVPIGASQCTACDIGKYQTGTDECATCEDGSEARASGTYATSGATECAACDSGKYQTGTDECTVCGAGTYAEGIASVECIACDDGSETRADGVYSLTGASECVACNSGKYQTGTDECTVCSDGSETRAGGVYAPLEATECVPCEAGKFSSSGGAACGLCGLGLYAENSGSASCTTCGGETRLNDVYITEGATQCVSCAAGQESSDTFNCEYVVCSEQPFLCMEPVSNTCGNLGGVNCDGECVNKERYSDELNSCPVMYSAFPIQTSLDIATNSSEDGKCDVSALTKTCVSWRGSLQNNFELHQVEALEQQDSPFCTELKSLSAGNAVRSRAPDCEPYFTMLVPLYVDAGASDSQTIFPNAEILKNSAAMHPRVRFDVVLRGHWHGAQALPTPTIEWQTLVTELKALHNVNVYGYIPSISLDAATSTYITTWSNDWGISDVYFDGIGDTDMSVYSPLIESVSGSSICNLNGTMGNTSWWNLCSKSVLFEVDPNSSSPPIPSDNQLGLSRDQFYAIIRLPADTDASTLAEYVVPGMLDYFHFTHIGGFYIAIGSISDFHDTSTFNIFVTSVDEWSIAGKIMRMNAALNQEN